MGEEYTHPEDEGFADEWERVTGALASCLTLYLPASKGPVEFCAEHGLEGVDVLGAH